ncbi:MAG: type II toxin-antitoxin system RatA family toxin [Kiloniellales bacterium]|nr:type II toxin-antitoxin system RatA family toxin [Kiloniellales bacterium]
MASLILAGIATMSRHTYSATFPYPAVQLFDLIADVERYPEFLPFWATARIRRREDDVLYVDQVIRLAILRWRFSSKAELHRPRSLRITSTCAPFRHLEIIWTFEEPGESECVVRLETSYGIRSRRTKRLVERLMDAAIQQYARAFEQRARDLLGHPDQDPSA